VSELAEISDEGEYGEMLQFVLNQWRNVRQRKRLRVDKEDDEDMCAAADNGVAGDDMDEEDEDNA
jgi:hypothetical protein